MDRREFMFTVGRAALAGVPVARGAAVPTISWKQQPLPFGKVRLTEGLLSGEVPPQGPRSTVDVWPYAPTAVASSVASFDAEALSPTAPSASQGSNSRVPVHFTPFYAVTRGKYSVWLPEVQL